MIESLRFENLNFSFDDGQTLFTDLNFTFPLNKKIEIKGNLGSGRSTLLKLLAGLLAPQRGHYWLNAKDVTQMSFEEFLPYRLRMGYAADHGGLLHNRTLEENLTLPLLYHHERGDEPLGVEVIEKRAHDLLKRYDIWEQRTMLPAAVSMSTRKACILARAFITEPKLLLLDDPFLSLDAKARKTTKEIVDEQLRERTLRHIFVTARYEDSILNWADEVINIRRGRLES